MTYGAWRRLNASASAALTVQRGRREEGKLEINGRVAKRRIGQNRVKEVRTGSRLTPRGIATAFGRSEQLELLSL